MTRSQLIKRLVEKNPHLTSADIGYIVDCFFCKLSDHLAQQGRVELRNFGVFDTKESKERTGRNPKTGQLVHVQAKNVPFFKAGKFMRKCLNT